jgi:molybdate transport system substrate-binding protein
VRRGGLAILVAIGIVVSACTASGNEDRIILVVSAGSSLSDAFTEIEATFETANPDIDVQLNLGGSSALREQILAGAPADVFAPADLVPMDLLVAERQIEDDPAIIATNSLAIGLPPGNPGAVTGLDDFSNPELLIGLCSEEVPCGRYARQILSNAGVVASIDTNEPDVRSLVSKIELGELDAGIVYATDVVGARGELEDIDITAEFNVTVLYPIAVLADSLHPAEAEMFVEFVLSDEGQIALQQAGFGAP